MGRGGKNGSVVGGRRGNVEEEEESTIKLDHWTLEEKKPWGIDRCPFGPIVIKSTLLDFRRKKVYIFRPLCPLFFSSPFLCVCTFITTCNRHITARVIDPSVIIPSSFSFSFLPFCAFSFSSLLCFLLPSPFLKSWDVEKNWRRA